LDKKIVFIDIDGTLRGMDGHIPASAVEACRRARKLGHLLYLCSGRNMGEIEDEIFDIGFDGIAGSGGAHIVIDGRVILNATMPVDTAKRIATYLEECRCGFALEKNHDILPNRHYASFWKSVIGRFENEGKTNPFAIMVDILSKYPPIELEDDSVFEDVNKIVFTGSGSVSHADIAKKFGGECELFRGSIPYSGEESGEIGPVGIHKGSALERIAEYHGMPVSDTVAFGDSDNDRPMLERAGVGIAMGNATPALKSIADSTTTAFDDDGLFNGFVKLGLI